VKLFGFVGLMEFIADLAIFSSLIIAWILFCIINIKTVRRLRKNPITKDELGFHLWWGWYALNIAEAIFFSKEWMAKRKKRSHGYLFANKDLVEQYTTPFEKIICKLMVSFGLFFLVGILILIARDGVVFLIDLVR